MPPSAAEAETEYCEPDGDGALVWWEDGSESYDSPPESPAPELPA